MVDATVRPIVEAIVAKAPPGWTRAVLSSVAGAGGASVAGGYAVRGASRLSGHVPAPFTELMRLAEAVRELRGWRRTNLEIECLPTGEYELVAFADAVTSLRGRAGGFQVVLDPGYRLPQPGFTQEEGTAAPAGDPDLAVARFRAYLERRAAILGRPEPLPPPASAAALEEAERRLGRPLPADLRALYQLANPRGFHDDLCLFGNAVWLGLDSLVAVHEDVREPMPPFWELGWNWVVFDTDPPGAVRRCGGHPAWLPFATSEDGNFLAVDMSPAPNGRPGQVIRVGRDHDDGPAYLADSVTSLLGHYLDLLERGAYEPEDEEEDGIYLPQPDYRLGPEKIIGELPHDLPPGLQAVHINDAPSPVDLTPLTAAPQVRRLNLNRCATRDLTPVRALPVESLRVTLAGGDLTPLAGHHHLAALDLGTATDHHAPVDLAPLRSLPHLRCLDLSRAEVADLTVLADLPDLRYLALTARQWNVLLEKCGAPATLAAARLADDTAPLHDALAWASRLGVDTGDSVRVTGG